jgi:hypothetical protein
VRSSSWDRFHTSKAARSQGECFARTIAFCPSIWTYTRWYRSQSSIFASQLSRTVRITRAISFRDRRAAWPNRVHLRCGRVVHLQLLPTSRRHDAVTFGYSSESIYLKRTYTSRTKHTCRRTHSHAGAWKQVVCLLSESRSDSWPSQTAAEWLARNVEATYLASMALIRAMAVLADGVVGKSLDTWR